MPFVPQSKERALKQIRKRLTYANVMSSIAVFLVLGGATAVAAKKIGTNEIKGNSITTGKVKKEAVTKGKIKKSAVDSSRLANNAVTTSKIADDAVTGDKVKESTLSQVPSAATAVLAESAQPQVFAEVNFNGVVNAANSKGLSSANVSHPSKGVYCITVPAFAPRGGQVTPIFGGTAGTTANLNIGGTPNCPLPSVQVLLFTTGAAPELNDISFHVELYH
jgi:hypothetical protein